METWYDEVQFDVVQLFINYRGELRAKGIVTETNKYTC